MMQSLLILSIVALAAFAHTALTPYTYNDPVISNGFYCGHGASGAVAGYRLLRTFNGNEEQCKVECGNDVECMVFTMPIAHADYECRGSPSGSGPCCFLIYVDNAPREATSDSICPNSAGGYARAANSYRLWAKKTQATYVIHQSGGACGAVEQLAGYAVDHQSGISEADCREKCTNDAECTFYSTLNHLAYASGWPRHCMIYKNAYCDPDQLTASHPWFETYLKSSAIPPVEPVTSGPPMSSNGKCASVPLDYCLKITWEGGDSVYAPAHGKVFRLGDVLNGEPVFLEDEDETGYASAITYKPSFTQGSSLAGYCAGSTWPAVVLDDYPSYPHNNGGWRWGVAGSCTGTETSDVLSVLRGTTDTITTAFRARTNSYGPAHRDVKIDVVRDVMECGGRFYSDALFSKSDAEQCTILDAVLPMAPTDMPSSHPTVEPTQTPTDEPSVHPTLTPTSNPTLHPSSSPSLNPTTDQPSQNPTMYSDGTLLQNGCPSDYPERYPGTNRCFGFVWGNFGCNIDPKHDPASHHASDRRCVYSDFVYVKTSHTNVPEWMRQYLTDTIQRKVAQYMYEYVRCAKSDGSYEDFYTFVDEAQRQSFEGNNDWFIQFPGMKDMWDASGVVQGSSVDIHSDEYMPNYQSCTKVVPLGGTRTSNGCPSRIPLRYPGTDRCFETMWKGEWCNVNPNQNADPVCQYEEDRHLGTKIVDYFTNVQC